MQTKDWEEYSEEEILVANIEKYNQEHIVKFYEDYEEPRYLYGEYDVIFGAVIKQLANKLGRPIKAVDLCGGAGKAAFVMKQCQPDCEVYLVDIADKMLEIASNRARAHNISGIHLVQSDAYSFLQSSEKYDLIVFSSAIHHFKDPVQLISTAAQSLTEAGLIITIADPTVLIKSRRYRFFQFVLSLSQQRGTLLRNCLQRRSRPDQDEAAAAPPDFDLAEYQTYTGIDDHSLSASIRTLGLEPLVHLRYPAGEPLLTKIMPFLGLYWAFSMVITKAGAALVGCAPEIKEEIRTHMPYRFHFIESA